MSGKNNGLRNKITTPPVGMAGEVATKGTMIKLVATETTSTVMGVCASDVVKHYTDNDCWQP